MKLSTIKNKALRAIIRVLEQATVNRQGGLLIGEQIALDNLRAEQVKRDET